MSNKSKTSSENSKTPENPKNVLPDLIIPVAATMFTIYYLTTITEVPWIAQASAVLVSCLLLLAILAYAIRTVFRLRAGTEVIRLGGFNLDRKLLAKRLALLALTVGYVWFLDILGFTISTLIFLFLSIILLSSTNNWKRALAIGLACSIVGYIVFIFIFETRFPKGPVEHFIEDNFDAY